MMIVGIMIITEAMRWCMAALLILLVIVWAY